MPLVQTRGAASAQGFGEFAQATAVNYIEDVFSTFLYTGTGSAQTITNGIDLSGKGGLVWIKRRDTTGDNILTVTGNGLNLSSNLTTDFINDSAPIFNSSGFNLVYGTSYLNASGGTYASWTFREQAKFFDIVTYTGSGANRTIAHNLGSVPGCIIIKSTNRNSTNWAVYHRSLANTQYLALNTTAAAATGATWWNSTTPTSSVFSLGTSADVNDSGGATYVAYLFAHDAGGFGLTGTDNVISCGSFTTDGSGNATVSLGYEPQWVMYKSSSGVEGWKIVDNMRGFTVTESQGLAPNSSTAEFSAGSATYPFKPTATGFQSVEAVSASSTYIYIAIRRGPMKVPTVGTSVYQANTYTGNATANTTVAGNFGFPVDLMLLSNRDATATSWSSYGQMAFDRLRGSSNLLATASTSAASFDWTTYNSFAVQNSIGWGLYGADSGTGYLNNSGGTWVANGFRRAPSFFDEVCYTGNGILGATQTHNLGVVPELMILKTRAGSENWIVYTAPTGNAGALYLSSTAALETAGGPGYFNNTTPTATQFTVGNYTSTNPSGGTMVAYLFATLAGVSKVGSYTGNAGYTVTVPCGFTAGVRFVLIKRTDSTGDWYLWDSARGIVAGNDPYLRLNSTAAEVTGTDYVDTYAAGFEVTSTAPAGLNATGGTYIFLAIA